MDLVISVFVMLSKYIMAALGLGLAVMTALFYRGKAQYEGAMRKGIEQKSETERRATNAMVSGLKREREARQNAKDAIANRTFFG